MTQKKEYNINQLVQNILGVVYNSYKRNKWLYSFSSLSYDRSEASSKASSPQCDPELPPSNESILSFLKVIQ